MKFIELKDVSIYGARDCSAKNLGDVVLVLDEIRGFVRKENDAEHTYVMMRAGVTLITATSYEEIKSKLITEDE